MTATTINTREDYDSDVGYEALLQTIEARVSACDEPLFTTDAGDNHHGALFEMFLDNLPPHRRQHYTCNACRRFVNHYGGLVTISEDGITTPLVWSPEDAEGIFTTPIAALHHAVKRAKVTGVFLSADDVWGQPVTGLWHHMAGHPHAARIYRGRVLTAGQAMAEKLEDYRTLCRGLAEFSPDVLTQALGLLQADALYRSEKVLGVAQWVAALHAARDSKRGPAKANVTWRAVATAPAGFCHIRSTMISTLLEDIASGMDFDAVAKRFARKMSPLQYQRPQVAPKAGNIADAERLVAKLGVAASLARRFARFDDVQEFVWLPDAPKTVTPAGGVFGGVKARGDVAQPGHVTDSMPYKAITWEKFSRDVLPGVATMTCEIRNSGNFYALVTAVDAEAPPIIQWDREDRRNPVSWYTVGGGGFMAAGPSPSRWNLRSGASVVVHGVCLLPFMWHDGCKTPHGEGAIFILEDCKDTEGKDSALFPEILRAETHGARATIEAFSHNNPLQGAGDASACGLCIRRGEGQGDVHVRVTTKTGVKLAYRIDRWD